MINRKTVKVYFENGDSLISSINGTEQEIRAYYVGQKFNIGIGPGDNMQKCVRIEFL